MKTKLWVIIGVSAISLVVIVLFYPFITGNGYYPFDERCHQGEVWLIEYSYSSFSLSTDWAEQKLSKNIPIYNKKLKIQNFESFSDFMKRFPLKSAPFDVLDYRITNNTHILGITCLSGNDQNDTKNILEGIDGITNARHFSSWIE